VLQVQDGGLPAAVQQLLVLVGPLGAGAWPVDAQDRRAGVGEHHGAERPWPDAGELKHAQPGQRPGSIVHLRIFHENLYAERAVVLPPEEALLRTGW
jgi:hypothetical protein